MIGDYLVVALVFGIAASYVAIIHHFWLRNAFKEEASSLGGRVESEGKCEINSALNESRSKAGCRPSWVSVQGFSRRQQNSPKHLDPGVMTLVGRKPEPQKKMLRREKIPASSKARVCGRS
jgi:hypothetical protein